MNNVKAIASVAVAAAGFGVEYITNGDHGIGWMVVGLIVIFWNDLMQERD